MEEAIIWGPQTYNDVFLVCVTKIIYGHNEEKVYEQNLSLINWLMSVKKQ